jgi:hypothetical protein
MQGAKNRFHSALIAGDLEVEVKRRTTVSGDFIGLSTYSPIGTVEPTGQHLEWEVIGIFRYAPSTGWPRGGYKPITAAS